MNFYINDDFEIIYLDNLNKNNLSINKINKISIQNNIQKKLDTPIIYKEKTKEFNFKIAKIIKNSKEFKF